MIWSTRDAMCRAYLNTWLRWFGEHLYQPKSDWIVLNPACVTLVFIFGTACQIYCYDRYCVRRSVSPQVPENPSGPLVDNFIVLPCVAFGVACVKLLPGVDCWNSLDDPRVYWTLPLRSVGVAPSLGRFWLVFTALKLRYVLRRHIILSDSDGNQGVLDCFTVYPGLGGSAK